jgi:hypothetical protein
MCSISGDTSHDRLYKYFGILSGRALLFRSHAGAVSNKKLLPLSPSLRRTPNSIDFCQYHAHLYEVCQWLERHEAVPSIIYILVYSVCRYEDKNVFSLAFGTKLIVLLRHGIYQTSRLIGENSCLLL